MSAPGRIRRGDENKGVRRYQVSSFRFQVTLDHGRLGCRVFARETRSLGVRNRASAWFRLWSAAAEGRSPGAAALDAPATGQLTPQLRTAKAAGRLRLPAALHKK
ncbi:MAG: hypothetical protein Kow00109_03160 [Acidobacteriota bacterium]